MTVRYRKDCQGWLVDINLSGHPRIRRIIPEARNKAQALQAEKAIINQLFDKKYSTEKAPLLEAFLKGVYIPWATLNKRSWKTDSGHCDVLIRFLGSKPLDQISPFDIERFKKLRKEEKSKRGPITATTVNRQLEVLSKAFSLALQEGIITKNPCRSVAKLRVDSRRYRTLSADEQTKLLGVLVGRRAHLLDIVLLDLETGLRRGEILKLEWEQVNLEGRTLAILNTKSGRDRFIPMTNTAHSILSARHQKRKGRYVFPSRFCPDKPQSDFKSAWAAALIDAGLKNLRFHDLRHTMATRLAEATSNAFIIQRILGHSNITTSQIYVNLQAESLRAGLNQMSERWPVSGTQKETGICEMPVSA